MTAKTFDILARRATAAASRRGALAALGGVTLSALLPLQSQARKGKKGKGKGKAKGLANKLCVKQQDQCRDTLLELCAGQADCLGILECCVELKTCDVDGFFTCLVAGA